MQFVEDSNGQIKARTRHTVPCKVLTVTIQHITDSTLQCQCSKTDKKYINSTVFKLEIVATGIRHQCPRA